MIRFSLRAAALLALIGALIAIPQFQAEAQGASTTAAATEITPWDGNFPFKMGPMASQVSSGERIAASAGNYDGIRRWRLNPAIIGSDIGWYSQCRVGTTFTGPLDGTGCDDLTDFPILTGLSSTHRFLGFVNAPASSPNPSTFTILIHPAIPGVTTGTHTSVPFYSEIRLYCSVDQAASSLYAGLINSGTAAASCPQTGSETTPTYLDFSSIRTGAISDLLPSSIDSWQGLSAENLASEGTSITFQPNFSQTSIPITARNSWLQIYATRISNTIQRFDSAILATYNLQFSPAAIPSAPTSPVIDDTAATGATVSWSPPTSNADAVTSYDVSLCAGGTCTVVGDDLTTRTYTAPASQLTVGTAYTFQIVANAPAGQSPALESGSFTWALAPSAPQNFDCDPSTNNLTRAVSISCEWAAPLIPKGLDSYRITYTINDGDAQTADIAADVFTYTYAVPYDGTDSVSRSYPTTTFLTAYNGATAGTSTSTESISVLVNPPPVTNFTVANVANGVTLTWTAPTVTTATGETFRIRYGVFNENGTCDGLGGESAQSFSALTDANELSSTTRSYRNTTQIVAGQTYCFEILIRKTYTSSATGFSSKFFRTATIIETADPPNPPTDPNVTVRAPGSSTSEIGVSISWTASASGTYVVQTYGITLYSGTDQSNQVSFHNQPASNTGRIYPALTLGSTYNFTVDARRVVGSLTGISDSISGQFTLLGAPSFTTSPTLNTIEINVPTVSGVTYEYAYKANADSAWIDSTSPIITGLEPDSVYDVRVRASGGIGFTPAGGTERQMTTPWIVGEDIRTLQETSDGPNDPASLESVAFSSATGSLRCSWTAPTGGLAVEGYEAAFKLQTDTNWTAVDIAADVLTHTFSPITVDQPYQCRVRAYRIVGIERRYSGWVTGSAVAYPANVSAITVFASADPQRIRVFWTNPTSMISMPAKKAISLTFDGSTTVLDDIAASATSHFALLPAGAEAGDTVGVSLFTYLYDDAENRSVASASTSVTIVDVSSGAPQSPTSISLDPRITLIPSELALVLSWDQPGDNPAAYEIDYRLFTSNDWTTGEGALVGSARMYVLANVEAGVTYVFRIRSRNAIDIGGGAMENRYNSYSEVSGVIAGQRVDPGDCEFSLTVPVNDDPTSLILSWTNPTDVQQNAEVPTAMIVEWRSATTIAYTVVRLVGTASEYTLPIAAEGARYDVQLRAEFGNGDGFSPVLVASIVVGPASESVECAAASDFTYPSLPLPPEVFDVHLSEIDADRDRISIRWTIDEDARLYEMRQISTSQDPTTLASYGVTNAIMEASSSGDRGGYAAEGHLIANSRFICANNCYLGAAMPMNADGLRYEIVLDRRQFPVLAMYVDQDIDSFYLVLEGDATSLLDSSNSDWLVWNAQATIHQIDENLNVSTAIFDYRTTLDPVFAAEIYVEPIPMGAFTFGTASTRTVVRWGAGGQSEQYGIFDPILPRPTLVPYQGSAFPVPATEHQVYVLHGTESWFSVRSLYPSGEYSAYSAPRHYEAGPLIERIIPFGENPAANPFPPPDIGGDFGTRAFLEGFGIGNTPAARSGIAVGIAAVASLALGAVGFMFTGASNVQTRVAVMLMFSITTWMIAAPTIGQLPFSFVAAPLILLAMLGIVAVLRRAG